MSANFERYVDTPSVVRTVHSDFASSHSQGTCHVLVDHIADEGPCVEKLGAKISIDVPKLGFVPANAVC